MPIFLNFNTFNNEKTVIFILFCLFGIQLVSYATSPKINFIHTQLVYDESESPIIKKDKKLSWVEKIAIKTYLKKVFRSQNKVEKRAYRGVGFALGFLFGIIGVGISYLIGKECGKASLSGWLFWIIAFLTVFIAYRLGN